MPGLSAEGGVSLSSVAALNVGGAATMPGLSAAGGVSLSTVDDTTPSTTLYRFENIDGDADALEDVFTRFSDVSGN